MTAKLARRREVMADAGLESNAGLALAALAQWQGVSVPDMARRLIVMDRAGRDAMRQEYVAQRA